MGSGGSERVTANVRVHAVGTDDGGRAAVVAAVAAAWRPGVNLVTANSVFAVERYRELLMPLLPVGGRTEVRVVASREVGDQVPADLASVAVIGPPPSPRWLAAVLGSLAPETGELAVFVVADPVDDEQPPADRLQAELVQTLATVVAAADLTDGAVGGGDSTSGEVQPTPNGWVGEWDVVETGRVLGSMPVVAPVCRTLRLAFAGRTWEVVGIDPAGRLIEVRAGGAGVATVTSAFGGTGAVTDDEVRGAMWSLLSGVGGGRGSDPAAAIADGPAARRLGEARSAAQALGLGGDGLVPWRDEVHVVLWRGDAVCHAVALALAGRGLTVRVDGLAVVVIATTAAEVQAHLRALAGGPPPSVDDLLAAAGWIPGGPTAAVDPVGAWSVLPTIR